MKEKVIDGTLYYSEAQAKRWGGKGKIVKVKGGYKVIKDKKEDTTEEK